MQVEKIGETLSVTGTGTHYLSPVPALHLQAFTTHRDEAFLSRVSNRETVVSELIFLG